MKYRVDLVSRCCVVVEVNDDDEDKAIKLAEEYMNTNPGIRPVFEFEGDDGSIEEVSDEEPDVVED